jgi:hypothetical protein
MVNSFYMSGCECKPDRAQPSRNESDGLVVSAVTVVIVKFCETTVMICLAALDGVPL